MAEVEFIMPTDRVSTITWPSPIETKDDQLIIHGKRIEENIIYVAKWKDLEIWTWKEGETIKIAFLEDISEVVQSG